MGKGTAVCVCACVHVRCWCSCSTAADAVALKYAVDMPGLQAWSQQYMDACVPVFKVVAKYLAEQLRLHCSLWSTAEQLAHPLLICSHDRREAAASANFSNY
jgi:hypothetical protein